MFEFLTVRKYHIKRVPIIVFLVNTDSISASSNVFFSLIFDFFICFLFFLSLTSSSHALFSFSHICFFRVFRFYYYYCLLFILIMLHINDRVSSQIKLKYALLIRNMLFVGSSSSCLLLINWYTFIIHHFTTFIVNCYALILYTSVLYVNHMMIWI